jgi:hypothetical protein
MVFGFTHALDVYLFCLAELTTVLALCDRAALFLYLEKRAICVLAGRGAVALDTCFAVGKGSWGLANQGKGERGSKSIPGVFFIAYKNLKKRRLRRGR